MKRWKRIVSLMLTLGMLLPCVPGSALAAQLDTAGEEPPEAEISAQSDSIASGYCGGEGDGRNLTWTLSDDGTLTISGTGAMRNYSIGGAPWFNYRDQIEKAVMEDGVTTVGDYAFGGYYQAAKAYSIKTATIPNSVLSIGDRAFCACTLLSEITVPEALTSVGEGAFAWCSRLSNITLPDSVTYIGNEAFLNCDRFTQFTIPSGVTSIGESTFWDCTGLMGVYFMGDAPNVSFAAFPDDMTLYYIKGKTGWTDSKDYDENAGTWNGYKLEVWSGLIYGGVGTETPVTYDSRDGSVTIENVPEDTSVVVAAYLDGRMIDSEMAVTSTVETVSLTLKKASGADEFRVFQTDSGYSPTATAIQLSLTK